MQILKYPDHHSWLLAHNAQGPTQFDDEVHHYRRMQRNRYKWNWLEREKDFEVRERVWYEHTKSCNGCWKVRTTLICQFGYRSWDGWTGVCVCVYLSMSLSICLSMCVSICQCVCRAVSVSPPWLVASGVFPAPSRCLSGLLLPLLSVGPPCWPLGFSRFRRFNFICQ